MRSLEDVTLSLSLFFSKDILSGWSEIQRRVVEEKNLWSKKVKDIKKHTDQETPLHESYTLLDFLASFFAIEGSFSTNG